MRVIAAALFFIFPVYTYDEPHFIWPRTVEDILEESFELEDEELATNVLVDELMEYLHSRNVYLADTELDLLVNAIKMAEQDDELSSKRLMLSFVTHKLSDKLGPSDPLIPKLKQLSEDRTVDEEQLLSNLMGSGGGTSVIGMIRTIMELKIAARAQALQSLNGSNVPVSPELLDEIWNRPYKVLSRTPYNLPKPGFSVTDAYCQAYGIYRCSKALKYGLGTNITLDLSSTTTTTAANAGGGVLHMTVPGVAPTTSMTTSAPSSTTAASSDTGVNALEYKRFYRPPENETFYGNVSVSEHPPLWPFWHHGYPYAYPEMPPGYPAPYSVSIPVATTPPTAPPKPAIPMTPLMPVNGVINPIILAPPSSAGGHGNKNKGLFGTIINQVDNWRNRGSGKNHKQADPLTYIYPLPVMLATEGESTPLTSVTTALPETWDEEETQSLYDMIVKRGQRMNNVVDTVAEVPLVGPAAVLLNGAANVGRDAVLTMMDAANAFRDEY